MGQTVDFNEIPDSQLLEPNMYPMEVDDLINTVSKAGNRMYKATLRVSEGPGEGVLIFDYFTIGSTDDPTASQQATWNAAPGARRLKQLLKALMVPLAGDIDSMVESAKGQKFIAKVDQKVDSGSNPQYAGSRKNVISGFYPLGSRATAGTPIAKPVAGGSGTVPKTATVACPYCEEPVSKADYSGHVRSKHPDEV